MTALYLSKGCFLILLLLNILLNEYQESFLMSEFHANLVLYKYISVPLYL